MLATYPIECAMCSPICVDQITVATRDRGIGTGLARDGRVVLWKCEHTEYRHGRITEAGRLALRLRSLVTA